MFLLILLLFYSICTVADDFWMYVVVQYQNHNMLVKVSKSSTGEDLEIAATHIITSHLLPFQCLEQCTLRFAGMTLQANESLTAVGIRNNSIVNADVLIENRWPLTDLIGCMHDHNLSNPENHALTIINHAVRVMGASKGQAAGITFNIKGYFRFCVIKTQLGFYEIPSEWANGTFIFSLPDADQRVKLKFLQTLTYCPVSMDFIQKHF